MNKFVLVLALVMFLVTSFLLLNIAAVGQAPIAMYWFIGGIGYCVSITLAVMTGFVE